MTCKRLWARDGDWIVVQPVPCWIGATSSQFTHEAEELESALPDEADIATTRHQV